MRLLRPLLLLVLPLSLVAAGCGGSGGGKSSVSEADVAVVGSVHITRVELDARMTQAERSYKLQKREFPKAGSPEYLALQNQIVQSLVQRAQLALKAGDLAIDVPDTQVEERLKQIKKQYFGGSEKRYQAELKRQGATDGQVREDIRAQLVSEAIFNKVTAGVKVGDPAVKKYYDENPEQYTTPDTRDVRHILVKDKATADKLYAELKGGADFAALAKKHSEDPGSKAQGGKLTISRGQTVPEFDATAFKLKTGELAKPVKTQFGWHVIEALSAVKPRQKTPFAQVKEAIRQQLLQQKRNEALSKWFSDVQKELASRTKYAAGFGPLPTAAATTTG